MDIAAQSLLTALVVLVLTNGPSSASPTHSNTVVGMRMLSRNTNFRSPYGLYKVNFQPYEATFEEFKTKYAVYYGSQAEEDYRFSVFVTNLKAMEVHNILYHHGNHTYFMDVNKFSDKTPDEYRSYNRLGQYSGVRRHAMRNRQHRQQRGSGLGFSQSKNLFACEQFQPRGPAVAADVPDSMDWRQKGAVTVVKNQGQCGSCWTFSATGAMEGSYAIKTGRLVSLSEQQIVDCCMDAGCDGCGGGNMDGAFVYVNKSGGLETESEYKYFAVDMPCSFARSEVKVRVTGCADIAEGDEAALKEAVALKGPMAVAIDAGNPSFQRYAGGVYSDPNCTPHKLDHGVLVVGYGTQDGQDYWIVKNSWGPYWGMQGYILMARNRNNSCGIATLASFPYTAGAA